jgi:hypothetical protein
MKNAATYFLGFALLAFAASIFHAVDTISSRINDAKYLVAQVPVVGQHVKEIVAEAKEAKVEFNALLDRADVTVKNIKSSVPALVPEAGTKIGEAGANMIKGFADKISRQNGASEIVSD